MDRDAGDADELRRRGHVVPRIVVGGTPSLPGWEHVAEAEIELSPGTCVLSDHGYGSRYADMSDFIVAAALLTHIVSKPTANRVTLDLGTKSVASDPPAGKRTRLLEIPDAEQVHHEEHLVIETPSASKWAIGDVTYAWPTHICPTCRTAPGGTGRRGRQDRRPLADRIARSAADDLETCVPCDGVARHASDRHFADSDQTSSRYAFHAKPRAWQTARWIHGPVPCVVPVVYVAGCTVGVCVRSIVNAAVGVAFRPRSLPADVDRRIARISDAESVGPLFDDLAGLRHVRVVELEVRRRHVRVRVVDDGFLPWRDLQLAMLPAADFIRRDVFRLAADRERHAGEAACEKRHRPHGREAAFDATRHRSLSPRQDRYVPVDASSAGGR